MTRRHKKNPPQRASRQRAKAATRGNSVRRLAAGTGLALAALLFVAWWLVRARNDNSNGTAPVAQPAPIATRATPAGTQAPVESTPAPLLPSGQLRIDSGTDWREVDDPSRDGWDSEVFSDKADKVLKTLGKYLVGLPDAEQPPADRDSLSALLAQDFSCGRMLPESSTEVFSDRAFVVRRGPSQEYSLQQPPPEKHRGLAGLKDALHEVAQSLRGESDRRFKFKLFRVEPSGDLVVTRQYLGLAARDEKSSVEQNATWVACWEYPKGEAAPKLKWLGLEQFEEVETRAGQGPLFADCTQSVLGGDANSRHQLGLGLNHWLERIQDTRYFSPLGNPGVALGDVNGDGLNDLYLCQEAGLPNRLYLQQRDGTLKDVSSEWGVDWLEGSRAALLIDLDNDSDQDLVVAVMGGLVVASNENAGRFELRDVLPTDDDTMTLAAADYDQDGDVDIYVCVDYPNDQFSHARDNISIAGGASNKVYHDANNAGRNCLFRNEISTDNGWRLVDVTAETGLDENNRRFSLAASWEDFDNDGDQDLYVANDFGRNNLYRNERIPTGEARFVDVARAAEAEDSASGMSVAWGDYDRDGWMDIYVGNMFSSAGNRITYQPQFKADASPEVKTRLQRFARGSTLLRNLADGRYRDVSVDAAVTVGRWAWSSNFVDINNDGLEDLVVANGYVTADDTGDL